MRALVVERSDDEDTATAVLSAIKGLPEPDTVVALSEFDLVPAAQVREELGVPGPRVDDALTVRDKLVMKSAVAAAGLRTPRFASLDQALDLGAASLPWQGRTVLKPVAGASSKETHTFASPSEALQAVRDGEVRCSATDFQIEEFVVGPILHIDGLLTAGEPVVIQASRYIGTCLDYARGQPLGSAQTDTEPDLVDWALRCLKAVGVESGPFHLEAIETARGPVFLEVGARCGSVGVVDAFERATGVRLPGAAVRLQVDGASALPRPRLPGPGERYGWFLLPGHTLGSAYCRISGEQGFRHDPLVRHWEQRREDEPLRNAASYAYRNVPLGGLLGPGSHSALERFITQLFKSVRVDPASPPLR
ncbi:ATP-grasp domain-containing protein [Streptomyces spongiae]|uniref:ATP-grasp domain-containing protein n=1 Tax=Streptomyces spongiae TaxID=565072 RepID=UPI002AD3F126|nr:ATP-grasp domain-containing protein [Streptomyces spongiae]